MGKLANPASSFLSAAARAAMRSNMNMSRLCRPAHSLRCALAGFGRHPAAGVQPTILDKGHPRGSRGARAGGVGVDNGASVAPARTAGAFERPPRIAQVLEGAGAEGREVELSGWVRSCRSQKNICFVDLNDGSCLEGIQVVFDSGRVPGEVFERMSGGELVKTGAAVRVRGHIQANERRGTLELVGSGIDVLGTCDAQSYPLQKKRHSMEFLRNDLQHLRVRTNTIGGMARIRSTLSQGTHAFFRDHGFHYVNTPIITTSDCEGAGEMFQVTVPEGEADAAAGGAGTEDAARRVAEQAAVVKDAKARAKQAGLDPNQAARAEIDELLRLKKEQEDAPAGATAGGGGSEFFGKPAFLTVSGQLQAECYALGLRDVYTFGPTFRAENSNTSRHLAEFWMVEPEMCFAGLPEIVSCAQAYVKHVLSLVLEANAQDVAFFDKFVSPGHRERLERMVRQEWQVITYTDAVDLLKRSGASFQYPVEWGADLQTEHERHLCERVFDGCPVFVTDYPKAIKAFYMRVNDDGRTVGAVDLLVPGVGELVGGSAREERPELLEERMRECGLEGHAGWYKELREFGTTPHAGFGLGFERLVQLATGLDNIRDCIPFPRYPGHADF